MGVINMAEHNLTSKLCPFLDRHLVLLLLDHLAKKDIFSSDDISKARTDVLAKTSLVDPPTETLKTLESNCESLLSWIKENTEEIEKPKSEKKYLTSTLVARVEVRYFFSL